MKCTVFVSVLLLIFSCSRQNIPEKDITLYDVKGKVNHLTIWHYYAMEEDGNILKGVRNYSGENDQTITFNKKGYVTQVYFYGSTDSLDNKLVRILDRNNRCLSEVGYNFEGEKTYENIWTYDENGNHIEQAEYLEDSTLFTSHYFHYNDKNQLYAQMVYRSPDNGLYDSLHWVLNEKGQQIEERNYGYYGMNNMARVEYDGDSKRYSKIYIYDNIEELSYILEFKYNDHDLLSEGFQYNADTLLQASIFFEYEYDKRGNWIRKVEYSDSTAIGLEERKIVYY
ncbi:MAG: hypothetical protein K9N05_02165 [Candidatus Marinimicrobia bacterium]|nr:hypothetical protein [Candidatus Neomarinimicrobiota bacterium]